MAGAATVAADPGSNTGALTRKAVLGVQMEPGEGGPRIVAVAPDSTAARAGVQAGDIITGLNGAQTPTPAALAAAAGTLRAGAPVTLTLARTGSPMTVNAVAQARPLESYDGATAAYGAVAFQGGQLRDILVTPTGARPDHPVVFLIQGYMCGTMEGAQPGHPYRAMAQGLAARGIATYRVEKPGMGDSLGGPQCLDTDFATELAAFRAGLKALIETHRIAPSRIVVFGHSMGGVQAPLLAAERGDLKGVAVMGTALRSWHDYMVELFRLQSFYNAGEDPVELDSLASAMRPLLERIFTEDTSLVTIAADNPEHAALLREVLQWDGKETILARTAGFWRGVDDARLVQAWRDAKAPVLTMYGEADFAAIDDRDHRLIVDIVNHYRPGTAVFVPLARTGHGFGLEGSRAEARAANARSGQGMNFNAPYNPELHKTLADWVEGLDK